jgi:uncharacterized phage infection (PIP) family protein YhgE
MSSLVTRLNDLVTRVATEIKSVKTMINGNMSGLNSLNTTAKSNLVASINELKAGLDAAVAASGAVIDDTSDTSSQKTYSITKIRDLVATSVASLTSGAPTALDTLKELADALGNDANFAATITQQLGARVRVDVANQGLTTVQKANARTNIDAFGSTEIGDPDTNFVTQFNAALV